MLKYVDVFLWRNVKTEEFALVRYNRWIGFKATYHAFSIFRSANAIDFSSKSLLHRSNLNLIHFTCFYVRKWIATVSSSWKRNECGKNVRALCCLVDSAYVASHRQNFLRHHQWIEITKILKILLLTLRESEFAFFFCCLIAFKFASIIIFFSMD